MIVRWNDGGYELFLLNLLISCACLDASVPSCYQAVPKSQKYFSLPAGKSLDSRFPSMRSSIAGKLFKAISPCYIKRFKRAEPDTSPGTGMHPDQMPDSH